jgi:hypothetical protein
MVPRRLAIKHDNTMRRRHIGHLVVEVSRDNDVANGCRGRAPLEQCGQLGRADVVARVSREGVAVCAFLGKWGAAA